MADPGISEFLKAAAAAVRGQNDYNADFTRGSDFEMLTAGPTAIIWSRQMRRDTGLFRAGRFDDAEGQDLNDLIEGRYGVERIGATRGTGTILISRTAAAVEGTIWKGTRIRVNGPTSTALFYRVSEDTSPPSGILSTTVAIEPAEVGKGYAIANGEAKFEDSVYDAWTIEAISCSDGTEEESPAAYRARARQVDLDDRYGHVALYVKTCKQAGATEVLAYRSDYVTPDAGLNVIYVGIEGTTTPDSILSACRIALRKARIAGDNLQVLPITDTEMVVKVTAKLRSSPSTLDTVTIKRLMVDAVQRYAISNVLTYSQAGLRGALYKAAPEIQAITLTGALDDASVTHTLYGNQNFRGSLIRYSFVPAHMTVAFE